MDLSNIKCTLTLAKSLEMPAISAVEIFSQQLISPVVLFHFFSKICPIHKGTPNFQDHQQAFAIHIKRN